MTRTILFAACLALAGGARAEVRTKDVEYSQGGTPLRGFVAWDDAAGGKRPGVLVVHEWWGQNQHARDQAIRLARAGYVGFALDMYGNGKVAKHPEDAKAFVQEASRDPAVVRARFDAALAALKAQPQVDPSRIGVVGYCFGGGVALRMARAGEDLGAVAVFHAAIPSADGPAPKAIKPRILIATGGADPMVPVDRVQAFARALEEQGAKVKVIVYPGVKHSFTNPEANQAGMEGLAYDSDADRRSWEAALAVFRDAFGS